MLLTAVLAILCALLLLVGLVGVILPFLPGIPLAWGGLFIYAIGTGFERISLTTTLVFLGLTLLALGLDFVLPMLGARKYQASRLGMLGAFVGFTLGVFVFNIWGVILGPAIGAMFGELLSRKTPQQALRASLGTLLGFFAGSLLKIVIILTMAGFFIASLF